MDIYSYSGVEHPWAHGSHLPWQTYYMAFWEERHLFFAHIPFSSQIWWYGRYTDDLLLIWEGTLIAIPLLVEYKNSNSLNLGFTSHHQKDSINFPAISLVGTIINTIMTCLYTRPTSRKSTHLATSNHSLNTINSLSRGINQNKKKHIIPSLVN